MIYLLGQIALCLLLAAIAGWFIGWSWRGFRESDRVDDLRHTLRATEEVKDRELAEAQRAADGLQSKAESLERRCERMSEDLRRARAGRSESGDDGEVGRVPVDHDADPDHHVRASPAPPARLLGGPGDGGGDANAESPPDDLLEQTEAALRDKTGALLQLQTELARLRADAEERAETLDRLQSRVSELEPLEERLRASNEELDRMRAALADSSRTGDEDPSVGVPSNGDENAVEPDLNGDERDRLQQTEAALRDKTAALLELQAELSSLRSGAEQRADELARLERRAVELEPLEESLRRRTRELERARAELAEVRGQDNDNAPLLHQMEERTGELEAAILERDRRINELRQRYQDTAARLEVAEADQSALRTRLTEGGRPVAEGGDESADVQKCRERLRAARTEAEEARATLQRQIERNRKQEVVHQQIVANLRAEIRDAQESSSPPPQRVQPERDARVQSLLADRDSRIAQLVRRVAELERPGKPTAPRRDDLKKIRGIGPKIEKLLHSIGVFSYAQIASWSEEEVARVSDQLGQFRDRIYWDDWVEGARRQHVVEYGEEPGPADWWQPE